MAVDPDRSEFLIDGCRRGISKGALLNSRRTAAWPYLSPHYTVARWRPDTTKCRSGAVVPASFGNRRGGSSRSDTEKASSLISVPLLTTLPLCSSSLRGRFV